MPFFPFHSMILMRSWQLDRARFDARTMSNRRRIVPRLVVMPLPKERQIQAKPICRIAMKKLYHNSFHKCSVRGSNPQPRASRSLSPKTFASDHFAVPVKKSDKPVRAARPIVLPPQLLHHLPLFAEVLNCGHIYYFFLQMPTHLIYYCTQFISK